MPESNRIPAGTNAVQAPAAAGAQAARAIVIARSKLGAPYVWATAGPETFDCSGFTWWVASEVLGPLDQELRSSHRQFNDWGQALPDVSDIRPGELLFFDTTGAVAIGNRASHVGLALGDGRLIHAARRAGRVRIDALGPRGYWPRFLGARRIFDLHDLRLPDGPILTRTPWDGGLFWLEWSALAPWSAAMATAARAHTLDVRLLAAVLLLETRGDLAPGAGPDGLSCAIVRCATSLAVAIAELGSWEEVIAARYQPEATSLSATPHYYVAAVRGLLAELGWTA
jgi:hypothetical protein